MSILAINGGKKVRNKLFPAYRVIGQEEEAAAARVLQSGILSRYLGCWHDDFYGGPEVQALERMGNVLWCETCYFCEFSNIRPVLCCWSNRNRTGR